MNETQISSAQVQVPTGVPAQQVPEAGASAKGWTPGRIAALVSGSLLVLVSLALVGAGGTGIWADATQRDAGYVTTGTHTFSTSGSALATESTHLGSPGVGWLYSPGLLGNIRVRVTPLSTGRPLFVGIGRSSDVDRYLAGVNRTVISDFIGNKAQAVDGGSWIVVAMNADGRAGVGVQADLGARMPAVLWIAIGLLTGGAVLLIGGGMLVTGAIRGRRVAHASNERSSDEGHQ